MALLAAAPARADVGRPDYASIVYSNQFSFDEGGVPVVRVGLTDGLVRARFSATGPVLFQPEGPGGPEVELAKGGTWTVTVEDGRPGNARTWVAVERVEPPDAARVAAALALWRSRGFSGARAFDRGALFGFSGEVMDTRYSLVAVGGTGDRAAASATARRIEEEWSLRPTRHQVLDSLPDGRVRIEGGGLVLSNRRVFRVAPASPRTRFVLTAVTRAGRLADGETNPSGRTYRGSLYFVLDGEGCLAVGNEISAEALLAGLVPAEIYRGAHAEALKAQAVTARNEVLAKVGTRHIADPYLLCDDVHCQVYPGSARESPGTTAAVNATRGEMLFRSGGLVDAVYSASCGGSSEANEAVWSQPPDPALRPRLDAPAGRSESLGSDDVLRRFLKEPPRGTWCRAASLGRKHFRWKRRVKWAWLTDRVNTRHAVGRVRDLRVTARGPGGRAVELVVEGEKGSATIRGELTIRRLFGGLKSALFVLVPERTRRGELLAVTFVGAGFGHGVGMCQVGAIGRAEGGQGYREVLRHYYGGAEVKRIY